jgi:hypothetical protein
MKPKTYLDAELSGEEDPGLMDTQMYMQAPEISYKVPPGVKTLAQWGQLVIPSGKKAGKTFQQVFEEDDGYLMQIKNRKAVSPWLRSFQNYLNAMWKHRSRQQIPEVPTIRQTQAMPKIKKPEPRQGTPSNNAIEQEWEKISMTRTSNQKRSPQKMSPEAASSNMMNTEKNGEKVEKLRTQIAILQRELAIETQIPEDQ